MRILWISHDQLASDNAVGRSRSGFWKAALLDVLDNTRCCTVIVASPGHGRARINDRSYRFSYEHKLDFCDLPSETRNDLLWIIGEARPDLIHVHGTELPYGLVAEYTRVPVVISLQGFLSESFPYVCGNIPNSFWVRYRTLKEWLRRSDFLSLSKRWRRNAEVERRICRINKYFIGRTSFDKAFLYSNNPDAHYYVGHEALRKEFYTNTWRFDEAQRFSVYASSMSNPLKGFHLLLQAVAILKQEFPTMSVHVPGRLTRRTTSRIMGNSYHVMLRQQIERSGLGPFVHFHGMLDGQGVCERLRRAHAFVLPSFVENSSNALGEAQILGVPCVVSLNGGTSSMIADGDNGLGFGSGDPYALAAALRRLFSDSSLALRLSRHARDFGKRFHDRNRIATQYTEVYRTIISNEGAA